MTQKRIAPSNKIEHPYHTGNLQAPEGGIVKNNLHEVSEKKIKNFTANAVNPNNGAAFEKYSDPLSSKGN